MRIQHNIMAMNAYRNYNNNTSALSKNLEKLSSGYRINRAGDDAAGLAISEKMRAQISGLEQASNNVKDGISLVQTGEGALQEVQDMLNRMVTLAEESANGTYQDDVDRENLQSEMDALKDEINRIADSANFNGINLLDGSVASSTGASKVFTITASSEATTATSKSDGATMTQTITMNAGTKNKTQTLTLNYVDKNGTQQSATVKFTTTTSTVGGAATAAVAAIKDAKIFDAASYSVATASGGGVKITAKQKGADLTNITSAAQSDNGAAAKVVACGAVTQGQDEVLKITMSTVCADMTKVNGFKIDGTKYQVLTRGQDVESGYVGIYVDQSTGAASKDTTTQVAEQLQKYGVSCTTDGTTLKISAGDGVTGGMKLQIGDTSDSYNQMNVGIKDMHTTAMGIDNLSVADQESAAGAISVIKNAINYVSATRGDLGAIQNRLEHTSNNLSVMTENIQDAESTIRDTDIADEMTAYTKNQILIQSAQAMLAQANSVPQGVLQLLQ